MRLRLQGGLQEIEIIDRPEASSLSILSGFRPVELDREEEAVRYLRRFWKDPAVQSRLRALASASRHGGARSLDETAILRSVAARLISGELIVIARRGVKVARRLPATEAPTPKQVEEAVREENPLPPPEQPPKKTWVKVELIGEDGQPIAGEKYSLELPDGSVKEGTLDDQGTANLEDLDEGSCKLNFPDLDQEAWTSV